MTPGSPCVDNSLSFRRTPHGRDQDEHNVMSAMSTQGYDPDELGLDQ